MINHIRLISFEDANARLARAVTESLPYASGKLGGTETRALFYGDQLIKLDVIYSMSWEKYARQLYLLSGVFPVEKSQFYKFCSVYYNQSLPYLDYLFLWQSSRKELKIANKYALKAKFTNGYFNDFFIGSWIKSLEGKRVLVVSPFAETIKKQYKKRVEIWSSIPGLLPEFELLTIKCPLYAHLVPPEHGSWMETLEFLISTCNAVNYDVLIAGAGAWGLPLAAHAKRNGKIGIHMGGATQLLFGIKGGRWDEKKVISKIYNEYWTYPSGEETPQGVEIIESSCYWKPSGVK
jgi:hypothetical protein